MREKLTWTKGGLHLWRSGIVDMKEFVDSLKTLITDSRFESLKYIESCFLEVKELQLEESDLKSLTELHTIPSIWNPNIKISFLVTDHEVKKTILAYMELMKHNQWQFKISETKEESKAWYSREEVAQT